MLRTLFAVLLLSSSVFTAHAAEQSTSFVEGIWYAHTPILAGETTRIYVALRNNSPHDITGTVRFTDNGNRIGIAQVSALPGRIVEAWTDWTPRYGEHTISASLTNIEMHAIGEKPSAVEVESTMTAEDTPFADYDTDRDGIPNEQDEDDDNDGMDDADERAQGRNPLTKDAPRENATTTTVQTPVPVPTAPVEIQELARAGLEEYLPEGTTKSAVEATTIQIAETKAALDAYRAKRKTELAALHSTTTPIVTDTATITRSKVEPDENIFEAVVRGGKALISGIFTLLLTAASKLLGHPALLQLFFLLFLVYVLYRMARRFGRRNTNMRY